VGSNRRLHKIRDRSGVRVLADIYPFRLCFQAFTSFCNSHRLAAPGDRTGAGAQAVVMAIKIELDLELAFCQADET
jgi:hypothetical protein